MNSPICKRLGIDFPRVAFSRRRGLAVGASRAGCREGARERTEYSVGQGAGLMSTSTSVRTVDRECMKDGLRAREGLQGSLR